MIVWVVFLKFLVNKNTFFFVFDAVLGLGEHREWAVGSPRAPANLPEWFRNGLVKKNGIEKCKHFDFYVLLILCIVFNSFG